MLVQNCAMMAFLASREGGKFSEQERRDGGSSHPLSVSVSPNMFAVLHLWKCISQPHDMFIKVSYSTSCHQELRLTEAPIHSLLF